MKKRVVNGRDHGGQRSLSCPWPVAPMRQSDPKGEAEFVRSHEAPPFREFGDETDCGIGRGAASASFGRLGFAGDQGEDVAALAEHGDFGLSPLLLEGHLKGVLNGLGVADV